MKLTEWKEYFYNFSVEYNIVDTRNIMNIHKYLMKKHDIKCLKLFLKMFLVLTKIVNASNYTKCVSVSNQKCNIQPTIINWHSNEYSHDLHYYQFAVKIR